jgi:hypothetical protein
MDHDDEETDDVVGGYRATTAVADHVKVSAFLVPAVITHTRSPLPSVLVAEHGQ